MFRIRKIHFCWKCFRAALNKIHLVDRCLILIMALLLAQAAISLFASGFFTEETKNIDIIIRTSAAAIFGYFLSANFISHVPNSKSSGTSENQPKEAGQSCSCQRSGEVKNVLGFTGTTDEEPLQPGGIQSTTEQDDSAVRPANHLQILAATAIGIFCLLVLILIRDIPHVASNLSESSSATISQFRDFVSGCVGFLIGSPTHSGSKPKA